MPVSLLDHRPATIAEHDLTWSPQPKQDEFLRATETEVLYGGAAFGGKSDALIAWSIWRRIKYPGSSGLFLRREFSRLSKQGAAIDRAQELLAGSGFHYNTSEHKLYLPVQGTESVIEFGHCENDADRYNYASSQYADICFDELTEFLELQYTYIIGRARTSVAGSVPRIRAATNPTNIGLAWVKARFVDPAPYGKPFVISEDEIDGVRLVRTGRFIPAVYSDNQIGLAKDPAYALTLDQISDPAERKAMKDGDWDAFAGGTFKEWNKQVHVIEPFEIPAYWSRWAAIDYGYLNPFCCLWAARDPDGPLYVYREAYGDGYRAEEQADMVKAMELGERVPLHYADPSMWQKKREHGMDMSIADIYGERNVKLTQANHDRIAGKARIHKALAYHRHETTGQVMRLPELRIFNTCTNLIRTLPSLPRDPNRKEDVDTRAEDHAYDALRYLVMAAPVAGRQPTKRESGTFATWGAR